MNDKPKYIGRFPIEETLGVGGMGVVYSAKDPDIGRKVAIKVLHATDNHEALERFKNEARTMGEISHPNIIILLEYGIDNNKPFLVMEYLEGLSLEKWIQEPHSLNEHKKILLNLCDALNFTHNKQILHRDLKPGNIQVLPTGDAKLLDFGIASGKNTGLTATGFFIGTPRYLAPEILQDTTHTKKSDCYSLGLLAYTMLRGGNPFSADSFEATMTRVLTKVPVSLHKTNPNIPKELSDAIDELLNKDPEKRPETTKKLKLVLELMTNQKLLNKTIVSTADSKSLKSQEKTILFGEQPKNNSKLIALATVTIVIIISILFYNIYTKKNNITVQTPNINIVTDHQQSDSDAPIETVTSNSQPETTSDTISTENPIDKPEEEISSIPKQTSTTKTPVNTTNKTTDKQIKPVEIVISKNEDKPVIKENIEKPIKKATQKQPDNKTKQDSSIVANNPQDKKIDEDRNEKPLVVAIQNPKKTTVSTPIFELPQLNLNTKKVSLKTNSDRQIPRGRTQSLRIEIPNGIIIDEYKIMKGKSEFSQVEIKKIRPISNNEVEIKLYAQSNAQMGDFYIIGIYQNKKTKPLILEVTL